MRRIEFVRDMAVTRILQDTGACQPNQARGSSKDLSDHKEKKVILPQRRKAR